MKRCKLQNALICLLLVCAFSISLAVPAFAADDVKGTISLKANGKDTTLAVLLRDGVWYAEIQSLAKIAVPTLQGDAENKFTVGTRAFVGEEGGKVGFIREYTTFDNNPTFLYTCDKDVYIKVEESYYVPIKEASIAIGVQFRIQDGKIISHSKRTIKEIEDDLKYIFSSDKFSASTMIVNLGDSWLQSETMARLYGVSKTRILGTVPFIAKACKTVLGPDEDDRFVRAFTKLLSFDQDMNNICLDISDKISKSENSRTYLATLLKEISKRGGKLEQFARECGYYVYPVDYLEDFNKIVDGGKIGDILSTAAFIEAASRFEESVIYSKDIFQNSENKRVKKTAQMVLDSIHPLEDIKMIGENGALGLVVDKLENSIKNRADPKGPKELKRYISLGLLVEIIDYKLKLSESSEAVIYVSIYSAIQNEILKYYYENSNDINRPDVAAKLLCAGRLYTKCVYELYKNFDFENSAQDGAKNAVDYFYKSLELLIAYSSEECMEEINNSNFIEYLTNDYQHLVSTAVSESEESETESVPVQYTAPFVRIYQSLLRTTYNEISDVSMYKYYVYDINGDGTPELLIGHGTCRADYTIDVYTIKNQYASYIGNIFGDELLAIEDGICGYYAQMGGEVVNVYSMNGDTITEDNFYEHDAGETYTEFSFLPSYDITDFSGLNWTVNPETGNNSEMLKKISGEY